MKEDQGTATGRDQKNNLSLLRYFLESGFDGNVEETALVLGRTADEIEGIMNGDEPLDEDLEMKIKGIAQERDIDIE